MKCALCGYIFDEKDSRTSCKGCPMASGCKLIRCPNCNYETPPQPKWLEKILKGRNKDGIDRKS